MTAAPSQTGIANAALVLLGTSARIGAINEGSPLSRQFFDIWDATRDEVQAAHPWNGCVDRVNGARDATYVAVGSQWAYRFEKPAGMLRWLPWERDHPDYFDGEEERGGILANDSAIIIRCIFRNEDMALWAAALREAMAAKLAAKTAKAITGQSNMMAKMDALFDDVIARAKREDGLATGQRNRRASFRSSWLDARQ